MTKKTSEYRGLIDFSIKFLVVFFITFSLLYILGLVPASLREGGNFLEFLQLRTLETNNSNIGTVEEKKEIPELPVHIYAPSAGIDFLIQNPESKDSAVLDAYLKKGIVRYPDSGLLGKGNVLLFGHSAQDSYPNEFYKVFNGVKNLEAGDEIFVDSENFRYVYVVTNTKLVDATKELVSFESDSNMITLSTCNTFGKKQDRHVSEAVFVRKDLKEF